MLCDEGFISSALATSVEVSAFRFTPSVAVRHVVDEEKSVWSKVVDLESCEQPDLSALIAHTKFLNRLSCVLPKKSNGDVACASLPITTLLKDTTLMMLYELSSIGSAFSLSFGQGLTECAVAAIISRVVLCIADFHDCGVLHREICAKHVLLFENNSGELSIRLCGLGSAAVFPKNPAFVSRNDLPPVHLSWRGWNLPQSEDSISCHPMAWYAPEVIAQDFTGYSWPSDIYSIGLTLAELYTGICPYESLKPPEIVLKKLCGVETPKLEKPGADNPPSQHMLEVYHACIQHDPSKRPSAKVLLEMPWIKWGLQLPFTRNILRYQESRN